MTSAFGSVGGSSIFSQCSSQSGVLSESVVIATCAMINSFRGEVAIALVLVAIAFSRFGIYAATACLTPSDAMAASMLSDVWLLPS